MCGLDRGAASRMEAFKDSDHLITLADLSTETGKDVQAGFRFLFMGAVRGIRDAEEALETLAFGSMLMRRLDSTTRQT